MLINRWQQSVAIYWLSNGGDAMQGAACFFGGVFLANFFPHFIAGMTGARFYTPFAKPPFRGLSSPVVNMLYSFLNLGIGYWLLIAVGEVELRQASHAAIAGAGFACWSLFVSRSVSKLKGT